MNCDQEIFFNVGAWSHQEKIELSFPERYDVHTCRFKGSERKKLTQSQIKEKIETPINSQKISQIVNETSEVAIIFDDLSRPTDFSEIAPLVLEELRNGNVKRENIRFVCATGAHGALTLNDFVQKLGKDIVAQYPVYNHNPFWGNRYLGETENGIPITLNEELYRCDRIIGLGAVLPHINFGFSGGGKIVFPGCCGIESIRRLHSVKPNEKLKLWSCENNILRNTIDEAAKICGLDYIVNVLLNGKLEITDLFAGDSITAFKAAADVAKEHYNSTLETDADVAVVNMLSRENESFVGQILGMECLNASGGILVIIAESGLGQVTHFATGNFGKFFKNKNFVDIPKPERIKKQIILSSVPDRSSQDWWLEDNDKIIWATSWDQVQAIIEEHYPHQAKITLIEDGGMQYDSRLNIEI